MHSTSLIDGLASTVASDAAGPTLVLASDLSAHLPEHGRMCGHDFRLEPTSGWLTHAGRAGVLAGNGARARQGGTIWGDVSAMLRGATAAIGARQRSAGE
jgi:hypothetical protein